MTHPNTFARTNPIVRSDHADADGQTSCIGVHNFESASQPPLHGAAVTGGSMTPPPVTMCKPLAIDLFCGLGGWTEGLLAEGYDVVGYDIEAHEYGDKRYPARLVIQDVLTLHGSQFKDAALIVASPPCQEYSYMAMPWKLAKAKAAAIRADTTGESLIALNRLFHACFRIQAEASLAAGRHIPMVVENVRGAIPWVGRSRWNFGSFHLWGDVPALMPMTAKGFKNADVGGGSWFNIGAPGQTSVGGNPDGRKVPGFRFDGRGRSFQSTSVHHTGVKGSEGYDREHPAAFGWKKPGTSSHSPARKAASAMIAKIPLPLSRHIAAVYREGCTDRGETGAGGRVSIPAGAGGNTNEGGISSWAVPDYGIERPEWRSSYHAGKEWYSDLRALIEVSRPSADT